MRHLASLIVVLAILVASSGASDAQQKPSMGNRPGAEQQVVEAVAVKEAILSSIVTVKGMSFPRVQTVRGCCQPYDTRSTTAGAIDLEGPFHAKKEIALPPDGPTQMVYSDPSGCWVVSTYNRTVFTAGGTYEASDDAQPANFNYLTATEYQSVLEDLKTYVLKFNISDKYKAELNAKLEELVKNYGSYANSITTSHPQVRHRARVWGTGRINLNQGHSWYHGILNVSETCSPPELRDKAALTKTLKAWADAVVKKIVTHGLVPPEK
jgi:hypothetical protein